MRNSMQTGGARRGSPEGELHMMAGMQSLLCALQHTC